jgi:hypothetical protein
MIIIDYPPGGLGNFLAQVITHTKMNADHLSFHQTPGDYDRLVLESATEFVNAWPNFIINHSVVVIHSFGHLYLVRKRFPQARIIQVVVNNEISIYMNNMYRKACEDNPNSDSTLHEYLIKHYGQDTQPTRRENYALSYLYFLNNKDYHNTVNPLADVIINFDNLYQDFNSFQLELDKITSNNLEPLFELFVKTQDPIITRTKMYRGIINGIKTYKECADQFDTIDHGLLAGMLQDKYKKEFFLPNQEEFECVIPR